MKFPYFILCLGAVAFIGVIADLVQFEIKRQWRKHQRWTRIRRQAHLMRVIGLPQPDSRNWQKAFEDNERVRTN